MGPGRTSTVHGCLVRQGGCGWPDFSTDDKRQVETTAQTQDDSNTGVGSDNLKQAAEPEMMYGLASVERRTECAWSVASSGPDES